MGTRATDITLLYISAACVVMGTLLWLAVASGSGVRVSTTPLAALVFVIDGPDGYELTDLDRLTRAQMNAVLAQVDVQRGWSRWSDDVRVFDHTVSLDEWRGAPLTDAERATLRADIVEWVIARYPVDPQGAMLLRSGDGRTRRVLWGKRAAMLFAWFTPPALIAAGVGVYVAMAVVGTRARARDAAGACARCGYDLAGLDGGVCPECGRVGGDP